MTLHHQTPSSMIETDRIEALSLEIRRWLNDARMALADEIRAYPTPIPRCDAQFNHLVEQRGRLSRLLTDLDLALGRRDGGDALRDVLFQMGALPPFGDSADERSLRDRIGAEFGRA
ncbi:MAG: hypothetical protein ABI900_03495 [Betaproteobacteria bacterium]